MNPGLDHLQAYPFGKLRRLKAGFRSPPDMAAINLSIGEPKHATPPFILDILQENLAKIGSYPPTVGYVELRSAIANWVTARFSLPSNSLDPDKHVLPVNGTREALFSFAQCVIDSSKSNPVVVAPNPFYQIYEGAALLAGAEPFYINCLGENGYLPDFSDVPADIWKRCQLVYICVPNNPTGAVFTDETFAQLFDYAEKYEFIIASDECYSEIYFDEEEPPPGLLEYAAKSGNTEFKRCMIFHSLSKRSNVPGLRSGFVAGDETLIQQFLRYRTYHGCAMPPHVQIASTAAWQDEKHVQENRRQYTLKFQAVLHILQPVLEVSKPDATFYLWPKLPDSDTNFTKHLYEQQHLTVLPGSFLGRSVLGINPGDQHVRIALVETYENCVEGAKRIKRLIEQLY
jgi:N-succinyldiaminopimelate aminotransferase